MKTVWLSMLVGSSVLLLWVLFRNKLSWSWLRGFALHLVAAAGLLYLLNYVGVIPGLYIPLNPITIGTVVVLGVPGVALMAGLQWIVV
ncbi:pro-sigmaK processing inhibitor BofA family protein [Paenibacillus sp. GSMTC-2017]|uniref:pro-sigmaK processing inhibitor BofA family protein n=1 Tax=Paenibacillus sp. GSMTC-2017 TaxID=2794350 RepID=UPI0018D6DCA8|nr:pro-sigmaK processing inhibitor BofA family protein [Paenibacillus sp. GSMTC-2017]MBH5319865.1 pro-sigmaK processing inhibitor BofA family protein [Paenibacillus sp. GSMTC-2017]